MQSAGVNVKHEIWMRNNALTCRRCARDLGRGELQVGHKYETCKGTAAGRALALLTGNTNHLWVQYAIPAMDMIRQGSRVIRAPKVPEIAVVRGKLEGFLETVEGRHSLRTCLGEDGWDAVMAGSRRAQDHGCVPVPGGQEARWSNARPLNQTRLTGTRRKGAGMKGHQRQQPRHRMCWVKRRKEGFVEGSGTRGQQQRRGSDPGVSTATGRGTTRRRRAVRCRGERKGNQREETVLRLVANGWLGNRSRHTAYDRWLAWFGKGTKGGTEDITSTGEARWSSVRGADASRLSEWARDCGHSASLEPLGLSPRSG